MDTYINVAGTYQKAKAINVKDGGAWRDVQNAWVKSGNSWQLVFSKRPLWTVQTSSFGATNINAVCYGNNLYVAVGDGGKIATSPDGVVWTQRTSNTSAVLNCICYGNGVYVAAGASGTLLTSTDGVTWTSRTSNFSTSNINSIAYGNSVFVACGASGKLGTSVNGLTWTVSVVLSDIGVVPSYSSVSFGNNSGSSGSGQTGFFIGGGLNGSKNSVVGWSVNGISWTMDSPFVNSYDDVLATACALDATFASGIQKSGMFGSFGYGVKTKLQNWTLMEALPNIHSICFDGDNQLLAVGDAGATLVLKGTLAAAKETYINNTNGANLRGCCYGNNKYIAVGVNGLLVTRNHYLY